MRSSIRREGKLNPISEGDVREEGKDGVWKYVLLIEKDGGWMDNFNF